MFVILCLFIVRVSVIFSEDDVLPEDIIPDVGRNFTWMETLKKDLLNRYDRSVRPDDFNNVTIVTLDMTVRHIDIEEQQFLVVVHSWMKLIWNDKKIVWNTSQYDQVAVAYFTPDELWKPDILLYNGATGANINYYGNTHLLANFDGTITWVPPAHLKTFCQLNFTNWPYDEHTCRLIFGSWVYGRKQIQLVYGHQHFVSELLVSNTEWVISEVTINQKLGEDASIVEFVFTVQRNNHTYKALVITPLTVTYYTLMLYFIGFTIIEACFVLHLTRKRHNRTIPKCCRSLLNSNKVMKVLMYGYECGSQTVDSLLNSQELQSTNGGGNHYDILSDVSVQKPEFEDDDIYQKDWILFAVVIDRLMFVIFLILVLFEILLWLL